MNYINKLVFFIFLIIANPLYSYENFIVFKVNNNIITKIDIENEYKYLIALNKNLEKLDKETLISLAKDSIIREKIKKDEIDKYFDINNVDDEYGKNIFENFYKNLGLNSKKDFEEYLLKYNLSYKDVKKKIYIEISWNNLIYNKFSNQIEINREKIKNKVIKNSKSTKEIIYYSLSEILFQKKENQTLENRYKEIKQNIDEIGFDATANIFSISETSKIGGKLGWVDANFISKNLLKNLKKIKIGDFTGPITIPGGFLILKLNDIKKEKRQQNINLENEINKLVQFEKNKQLDKFSKVYFNRIKKNSFISE